ncbi:MAG: hypothetical protein JO199_10410 [Candidatus Eremiobacteraeota bacterium]|nr:hypothetical protein [Candidatus Eremiobacteraeota bacterium]
MKTSALVPALVLLAAGCAGGPSPASLPLAGALPEALSPHPVGARAKDIFFSGYLNDPALNNPGMLGVYPATTNGNVAPPRVISGSKTAFGTPETAIIDTIGQIWTCSFGTGEIVAFAPNAKGNVAPVVTITGSKVDLNGCGGMALAANESIYASSFDSLTNPPSVNVYPASADNNTAPTAQYIGSSTKLWDPSGLAFDSSGKLYVGVQSPPGVAVFGNTAGNVAPLALIQGSKTKMQVAYAVAIDPTTQNVLVADEYSNAIFVFKAGANGNVAPIATISGANTKLNNPYGVAVDNAGYIYVGNCPQKAPEVGSITVYKPGSKGNVAPVQLIAGTNVKLTCVGGLTVK